MNKFLFSLLMFTAHSVYPIVPQSSSSSVAISSCIDCGQCMTAEHAYKYRCHACAIKKHEIKATQKDYTAKRSLFALVPMVITSVCSILLLKLNHSINTNSQKGMEIYEANLFLLGAVFIASLGEASYIKHTYNQNRQEAVYHREQAKKLQDSIPS